MELPNHDFEGSGSFWDFLERDNSIVEVLQRPGVQLDDVLDFDNVIRDVRYKIDQLMT